MIFDNHLEVSGREHGDRSADGTTLPMPSRQRHGHKRDVGSSKIQWPV